MYKSEITNAILRDLQKKRLIDTSSADNINEVKRLIYERVKDLTEFSRAIHAEMHALLSANKLGAGLLVGGKIFVTTYPCHSCARHIVAAGLSEVYFIEPYPKSLAKDLHGDAITELESHRGKVRIIPYDGVAPARYMKLFGVAPGSRKSEGKMVIGKRQQALPRSRKTLESVPALESLVVRELEQRALIHAEPQGGS
jgi:deoxycytidylate deaminase